MTSGDAQAANRIRAAWAPVMRTEQYVMAKKNDESTGLSESEQELQKITDEANEQGFYGIEVDPTPNENYTLQGQASGAKTPETDAATRKEAQAHAAEVAEQLTDSGEVPS